MAAQTSAFHALNFCELPPWPESQELATDDPQTGWKLHDILPVLGICALAGVGLSAL